MKRTIFSLLSLAALLQAADPVPATPQISPAVRAEFAEARAAQLQAQAVYDAFPGEIKKAFEAAFQALQGAQQAAQNAVAKLQAECGTSHQPVQDPKAGLVCTPKAILDSPPAKQ